MVAKATCRSSGTTRKDAMNEIIKEQALIAAKSEVDAMLGEHWDQIQEAFAEAYQDFCKQKDDGILSDKEKFRYPIALKVTQQPRSGEIYVKAAISWGVTHKDETDGIVVSAQRKLPIDA